MVNIHINNKNYKVDINKNLLDTCLSLGYSIPYFCWHPALGSLGACRQCAVKMYLDEKDKIGTLVMSCMTPVKNGIFISLYDKEVKKFQKNIIECMMLNHPLDCPICEEGGSCHLQDMTIMTKHHNRRYEFNKRVYKNQYLGPFINHQMNRCITCYRCIRFYKEYAGGDDFNIYGISNKIYFGRNENGNLENEFSGNLVEICPTGVFTDKLYSKIYRRKWDMQYAPSICHQCSIGCNILPAARDKKIRKIENRYNVNINRYFICDRGRFGSHFVNIKARPKYPLRKINGNIIKLSPKKIISKIIKILKKANNPIGIGSSRASLESNFALRELVGKKNFYISMSSTEYKLTSLIVNFLKNSNIHTPSLKEVEENYDAILILGEDITQTGARFALSVRQAINRKKIEYANEKNILRWQSSSVSNYSKNKSYPLFIFNTHESKLDDIASWNYYAPIENQASVGFTIAKKIHNLALDIEDTFKIKEKINIIVNTLIKAKKPLIVSGVHTNSEDIIQASCNIVTALKKRGIDAGISFILSEVNSMGSIILEGLKLKQALNKIDTAKTNCLFILESDIYKYISKKRIFSIFKKLDNIIVLDHIYTKIHKYANLLLPVCNFVESNGTVINNEGRVQRFFSVYNPNTYNDNILASWSWLRQIYINFFKDQKRKNNLADIIESIEKDIPQLKGISKIYPKSNFNIQGKKIATRYNRYSGISFNKEINKSKITDYDNIFTYSSEGINILKYGKEQITHTCYPGWNSVQVLNKAHKEINTNIYKKIVTLKLFNKTYNNFKKINFFKKYPKIFINLKYKKLWKIVPYYNLFSVEDTSQLVKSIRIRMNIPSIIMNFNDVKTLNFNNKDLLEFYCNNSFFYLPLLISKKLNSGLVGLPIGIKKFPFFLINKYISNIRKING